MTGTTLLFDIGNSRVKWAWLEGARLHSHGSAAREQFDIRAVAGPSSPPSRIVASNVAAQTFAERFIDAIKKRWGVAAEFISADAQGYGVSNAYREPRKLGADRWAALIGARSLHSGACCIVDCGTAVTVDVLAQDGRHLGGVIMPGLHLMRRALLETAQVTYAPGAHEAAQLTPFAHDTQEAVTHGTLYAVIAGIERAVAEAAARVNGDMTRFISGGDAARLLPFLGAGYRHEPHLV
ncbi:MAG: type III pantothenate kinase, partial [Gammaproteobacteria bacterium]